MEPVPQDHALRQLFSGLVENAFCAEVGMCDPALTSYVVDLLVDFVHVDRLRQIDHSEGRRLDQIATMLAVAMDDEPISRIERDRATYRHIGDYTLFWAGVYPEQLKRTSRRPADVLLNYVSQGKQSYAIVSQLAGENTRPPASLFRHLSEDFEFCLYGLGLVRRAWEHYSRRPGECGGDLVF